MRIVDISSRLRTVSAHSRRRIVQTIERAHQAASSAVGPDAHDLEVDLLERGRSLADLDDVGAGRDQRPDERRRDRRRLVGGDDRAAGRAPRRAPTPSTERRGGEQRRRRARRPGATSTPRAPSVAAQLGRRVDPQQRRRGRTRPGRTAGRPRRGCGWPGRSSDPDRRRRLDRLADDERRLRVERRGRLVEEDDRRLVEQRAGDRELLLHALAERAGRVVAPLPEREQPQVALDPLGPRRRVQAVQPAEEVEVGRRRQLLVEARRLGQDADPRADVVGSARGRRSPSTDGACPRVGSISAVSSRTVVVLPAPFGPSSPSTSPRRTSRSTPRIAQAAPNRRPRPVVRIMTGSRTLTRQVCPKRRGPSGRPPG